MSKAFLVFKGATVIVAGAGVRTIVSNVVKATTPEDLTKLQARLIKIGGWTLTSMASAAVARHVNRELDDVAKSFKQGNKIGEKFVEKFKASSEVVKDASEEVTDILKGDKDGIVAPSFDVDGYPTGVEEAE